jgi:hypothetical protein
VACLVNKHNGMTAMNSVFMTVSIAQSTYLAEYGFNERADSRKRHKILSSGRVKDASAPQINTKEQ